MATQPLEIGPDVLGLQAEMPASDVVGLHVDAARLRLVVLEQLGHGSTGKLPERALELEPWIPHDPSREFVLARLPEESPDRLGTEQQRVKRDRAIEARHCEADVIESPVL